MDLARFNPHWAQGFRYPYNKHRKLFQELLKKLGLRQILQITGLRRTGKTTLLLQLINHLLDRGWPPLSLWYFTFDEATADLQELVREFHKQTGVDPRSRKIVIFLDEIQKLPDFQNQLKILYDLNPNLKFVITGSSSLFIRKRTQESLAGRIFHYVLLPLDFDEYLQFTGKTWLLERPLAFASEIYVQFEIYLRNQFIESITIRDDSVKREYYESIIRKIVFEDIPRVFPVERPETLWSLVKIFAQRPGLLLDYQHLAQDLGVNRSTVSSYVLALEESYLIRKFYNFSRNLITSEKKLRKVYLASPSFSWALVPFHDTALLVENTYASLRNSRFFWRDSFGHEVDFIEIEGDAIVPVEVKYKERLSRKDLRNLRIFARRFGVSQARVYLRTPEPPDLEAPDSELRVQGIPAFQM